MSSIGLIINDKSNRSASIIDDLLYIASPKHNVRTEVLNGISGLGKALTGMNRKNVDTLILAGGDGTMQATFTESINSKRFDKMPNYVALPCGMTNVIANDCGLKGAPAQALDNFLWRHEQGSVSPHQRKLLGVSSAQMNPVYGFFLGAAGFHTAVQFSRSSVQSKGAKRSLALIASIASSVAKLAFDRENAVDEITMDFLEGGAPGAPAHETQALFMATTLTKLGSGVFPFWGQGNGAMNSMTVSHPAKRLIRAAPFVLRGKSRPWFSEYGLHGWRANQMVTRFTGPFVFDGEIFQAKEQYPVTFSTKYNADFLS